MKLYRSNVDPTRTISVQDHKAERFDRSASWELISDASEPDPEDVFIDLEED